MRKIKPLLKYNAILRVASPLVLAYTLYRALKDGGFNYVLQRFGIYVPKFDAKPVCIHCASVGEVSAALPLIEALQSQKIPIVITTHTPTGRYFAKNYFAESIIHIYFPLDYIGCVRRWLERVNPSSLIVLETEIWPNFYNMCKELNIPISIINARLTNKTMRAPRFLHDIYKDSLSQMNILLARTQRDAALFQELGMPEKKIFTIDNIKYSSCAEKDKKYEKRLVDKEYVLASSLHSGEENIVASCVCEESFLVIAPRYPDEGKKMQKSLQKKGYAVSLHSKNEDYKKNQIHIVDTLGDLDNLIGHALFVIFGGSFIKVGGHNLLEAGRVGKTVIVGPSMENFSQETNDLEKERAIFQVKNRNELQAAVKSLLSDKILCKEIGDRARNHISLHSDAAMRYMKKLQENNFF